MSSRFFRISLAEVAYVRAILEGYDGLAVLRVPDPDRGEVEWLIGEGLEQEAEAIAKRLEVECGLVEISPPADWSFERPRSRTPKLGRALVLALMFLCAALSPAQAKKRSRPKPKHAPAAAAPAEPEPEPEAKSAHPPAARSCPPPPAGRRPGS